MDFVCNLLGRALFVVLLERLLCAAVGGFMLSFWRHQLQNSLKDMRVTIQAAAAAVRCDALVVLGICLHGTALEHKYNKEQERPTRCCCRCCRCCCCVLPSLHSLLKSTAAYQIRSQKFDKSNPASTQTHRNGMKKTVGVFFGPAFMSF